MNRTTLWKKLALVALPIVAFEAIDCALLPIDSFAHRPYDVIGPRRFRWFYPGPMYPELRFTTVEEGDLAFRTPRAVRKTTTWETDAYGCRNRRGARLEDADVIVVGDSMAAGTGLDQADTFPEQLARELGGVAVYGLAPLTLDKLPSDARFARAERPHTVVYVTVERLLPGVAPAVEGATRRRDELLSMATTAWVDHSPSWLRRGVASALFFTERLVDPPAYFALQARIRHPTSPGISAEIAGDTLFLQGRSAVRELPEADATRVADVLATHARALAGRGMHLVVAPVPNKETALHGMLGIPASRVIPDVARAAAARGVDVVDLQTPFLAAADDAGPPLYHTDDTHWSPRGVHIAAEHVARHLRARPAPGATTPARDGRRVTP